MGFRPSGHARCYREPQSHGARGGGVLTSRRKPVPKRLEENWTVGEARKGRIVTREVLFRIQGEILSYLKSLQIKPLDEKGHSGPEKGEGTKGKLMEDVSVRSDGVRGG